MAAQRVFIASDHAGFELKQRILQTYQQENTSFFEWIDLGPNNSTRVDYPDYADLVAEKVNAGAGQGILICGSAQGMAMRANKYPHVRAAVCWNEESCELSRQHNDANILCLAGRLLNHDLAVSLVRIFLSTRFEGGRHQSRINKVNSPIHC